MASLILKPHLFGRCTRCILAVPIRSPQPLRSASTVAKPVKAASKTATASVPKKKISTKSTAAATPAKSPRKKSEPAATAPAETPTPTPALKKTTRSASTKSTASAKKSEAGVTAGEVKTATTRTRKTTPAASKPVSTAPAAAHSKPADAPPAPKTAPTSTTKTASTPLPEIEDAITQEVKGKVAPELLGANVDTSGPEYKQASRRYVSVMVALPILLVTSYYLFDRCESSPFPVCIACDMLMCHCSGLRT